MSIIIGTMPPKPAAAYNGTSYRPPAIDSRTPLRQLAAATTPSAPVFNVAPPLPSDVASLRASKENIERRLLASQVLQAGGIGQGITLDDLAKLPLARLQALRLSGPLGETFINHRLAHEAAASGSKAAAPVVAGKSGTLADVFLNHRLAHEA